MSKPVWFPLYANDFLASNKVSLMTTEEVGSYFILLCREWADPHCRLPSDEASLQRMGRFTGEMTRIRACFIEKDGFLYNERLYAEWNKTHDLAEVRAKAGKKGMAKRWDNKRYNKRITNTITNDNHSQSQSQSESESESESEKEIKITRDVPKRSREAKSSLTWESYKTAYESRYGVVPIRNASCNSLLCQLVDKLGQDKAPTVAAYYLTHPSSFYLTAGHSLTLLVRDAQKLLTESLTGQMITTTQARQDDGRAARGQMWQRLIDKEQSRETEDVV